MSKKENVKEEENTPSIDQNGFNEQTSEEKNAETPTLSSQDKTSEEKLAELNDKYLRLYADFENFRKRVAKERVDLLKYAGEDIFKKLIPVMDDFDRAIKASAEATDIEIIRQGKHLIYNKFKNILAQNGVKEMNASGESFDPELHDAITNIPAPSEKMKGKVIEEVEKGYLLNGKVIRHAKVIVGN